MKVEFKYADNKGMPSDTNIIKIWVEGQLFVKHFAVSRERKCKNDDREKARLFGECLKEIGIQISRQAEFGKPLKTIVNKGGILETEIVCF